MKQLRLTWVVCTAFVLLPFIPNAAAETEGTTEIISTALSPGAMPIPLIQFELLGFAWTEPPARPRLQRPDLVTSGSGLVPDGYWRKQLKLEKIENTFFKANLLAMAALNVADYWSTRKALSLPGLQESNPLLKPFVKNDYLFAAVKAGMTVLSHYGMMGLYKSDKKMAWVLTTFTNFFLTYAVINNLNQIGRAQRRQT